MIHRSLFCLAMTVLALAVDRSGHVAGTQVPRVRGIPISKSSLYRPERDFECLDGSRLMPFERVNDDYCDCGDGSDEPGTAACGNGVFFCQNAGHQARYVPSSRVNDGICDCCDASDEYASGARCLDNCHELGREARLEAEKAAELAKEGNKIRQEMLTLGKRLKTENQAKLSKLRADYDEALLTKKEKEALKNRAEERENAALEKYKPAEAETLDSDTQREGEGKTEVESYFNMIDSDNSGSITVDELRSRVTFDKNGDGEVTEEEAMFFLDNKKELKYEEFVDVAWANIKPFLMREQGSFRPPSGTEDKDVPEERKESPEHPVEEDAEAEGEEDHHEQEEEEEEEEQREKEPAEPEIHYDEETQTLIDEATQARERYQETEKSVHELTSEIRRLEERIERDYGPEEEFSSLDGECFETRDLEYVYTLCLFGKATQRSISGGAEVNLGHFQEWTGPETNKYSRMKHDRGLTCWNGPARNTVVNLRCGKENRLLSVTEPSRCEYSMEFTTPALCNPSLDTGDSHDEL